MALKNYKIWGKETDTRAKSLASLYSRVNEIFGASATLTAPIIEERIRQEGKCQKHTFTAYGQLLCESLNPYELRGDICKTREETLGLLEKLIKETAEEANTKLTPMEIIIEENVHNRTFSAYARCIPEDGSDYRPSIKETAREVECWQEWERQAANVTRERQPSQQQKKTSK